MKKLVLFFAVIVAVSFASCKKQAAPATEATSDTTAVQTEQVADTAAAATDTTVAAK